MRIIITNSRGFRNIIHKRKPVGSHKRPFFTVDYYYYRPQLPYQCRSIFVCVCNVYVYFYQCAPKYVIYLVLDGIYEPLSSTREYIYAILNVTYTQLWFICTIQPLDVSVCQCICLFRLAFVFHVDKLCVVRFSCAYQNHLNCHEKKQT